MGFIPCWGYVMVLGMATGKAEMTVGRWLLRAWGQIPQSGHSVSPQCHSGGVCWKTGPGERIEASPAARLCQAVLLARPCLPKLLELHDLELAKR